MPTVDPHLGEAVFVAETDPAYAPIAAHREYAEVQAHKDAAKAAKKKAEKRARREAEGESDGSTLATGRGADNVSDDDTNNATTPDSAPTPLSVFGPTK